MDKTQNYSLQKPLSIEKYSISVHNMNMDLIDSALKRIEQKNESQDSLLATKEALNEEIVRATIKENEIIENLEDEIARSKKSENDMKNDLLEEIIRATTEEENNKNNLNNHISDNDNPHGVTKEQIYLGNVDNTSDINKPVSILQQAALDEKIDVISKGVKNGIAELDENGKVPSSQLPSFVDDVIDGYFNDNKFYEEPEFLNEIIGEPGKIYIDLNTNKTYRWSGSVFAVVSETLALGETSSTAYRGDKGKKSYEHSQIKSGNPHNVTASDIGLGNVENKSSNDIRKDITYDDVVNALGYAPLGHDGIGEMRFEIDENYDLILIAPDGYNPPLELDNDGNLYYLFS